MKKLKELLKITGHKTITSYFGLNWNVDSRISLFCRSRIGLDFNSQKADRSLTKITTVRSTLLSSRFPQGWQYVPVRL